MKLFNNMFKKLIIQAMKKQFFMFLDELEKNAQDESSLFAPNRESRRKNKTKNSISKLLGPSNMPAIIRDAYNGTTPLSSDSTYYHFLCTLVHFYNTCQGNKDMFVEVFIKPFIKNSKKENVNVRFLDYFDDSITPKVETIDELNRYIRSIIQSYKEINPQADLDEFIDSIVPKEILMKAEGIRNAELARKSKERFERNIQKRKETRKKESLIEPTPQPVKEVVIEVKEKEKRLPMTTEEKIIQLYESGRLLQYYDNINEFEAVLRPRLTKQEWNKLLDEYNNKKHSTRMESIFGKEQLRNILRQIDLDEYNAFLSSSNFDNLSDDEIKSFLNNMMISSSEIKTNLTKKKTQ